ncbi:hypothetical protein ABGB17_30910 [Sphaerisporangium sp. B11E5]|uniref:hypothetical protein n=1 Tax=Sphaerisporangium sp. B11E5 TaxID=3153563 RepID=UPI00325CEB29
MRDTMTVQEAVAELREMLAASGSNTTIADRLARGSLSVLYEFLGPDGAVEPYVMRVRRDLREVAAGAVPYDQADIVIRTEPLTLHRLTSGELGGREAIVSGRLDIRKAPSMPKLLFMRSLFNSYKKTRLRAGPPTECAVEASTEAAQATQQGTSGSTCAVEPVMENGAAASSPALGGAAPESSRAVETSQARVAEPAP